MSTTDVECFQGKIFYNSDCSAVIIDPNEQNAKDEKKNNQTQPPPPIIHTFRVVTASDVEKNSDLQKTIPQKPILMCFICKLSFGNVQIFQQHSNSEHGVHLQKTEQVLLAREFSSAIIQRNGQESPQISFLEPIVMEDNKDENTAVTTVASNFLSLAAISNIFQYSHQKPALGVCQEHGNVKGNDCKTCELGGLRTSPPSSASSFTIGACPEHVSGRPLGVECSRCELILSTSRLTTNAQTMSSTRNSCKTLKCPQCNWHYKYQETLEIHMREKHPDGESACGYCLAAQPHPRLARGESYTCGYKPYRCEICNYSTTTKGNLSIHMQSDKHLNNMQELNTSQNINLNLNGPSTQNIPQPPPPPVSSVVSQSSTATPVSSQTPNKPKPNFRCDVCSYETSVARNLRIHMTSEKHTHNISVLQSNMKHFQTLNMIQQQQQHQLSNILPENFGGSGLLPEAAIADMAYNQAIMLQLLQSSNQRNNEHIEISEAEQGLNPDTLEPPFTLDLNPLNIFTCLICESFHTHSLEDLNNHLLTDRSRPQTPNTNDIMLVMNNNYICRLCSYKTNLKANYQLHSKTDKHLQKLNYINHIKEGGSRTEHKLNFPNSTTVQLKCNACEFYTNSMQKLTMHCGNGKHEKLEDVLKYLINRISNEQSFVNIFCKICDFTSENVIGLMRHLRSGVHTTENFDEISKIVELHLEEKQTEPTIEKNDSLTSSLQIDISTENGSAEEDIVDIVLKCNNCEYFASTKPEMEAHIDNYHENCSENYYLSIPTNPGALKAFHAALAFAAVAAQTSPTPKKPKIDKKFLCPLCESAFCQKAELEEHLVTIHSVNNSESVNRLLKMLEENSHSISSSHIVSEKHVYKYRCKQCSLAFKTEEKLTNHSLYHTMRDATKCFICHRTFRSTLSLQKHMESHDKEQEAGILEDEPLLEAPNPNDNEISSSVEASTSTPSILSSNIPQQQLSQTNSTTFNQTQPQLDVLSLMHFHHQLMSLNFMNLAPPLSFGPSHLSSNNTLSNNSDLGAVNLAKPVLPASTDSSEHLLPNIQQGNNQKRARTRITDDQLKILRAHFDINNSPSEESILEMSKKANLPMKVVKHWFRNTLFKERQRNKDSPYNFANPPSTTLNLEEYERTGQTSTNLSQKSPTIIDESINNSRSQPQPPPDFAMVSLNEQEPDNSSSSLDLQIKVEPIEHEFPANSSETENRSESECSEREIISRPQTPGFGDFLGPENFHQMGPPKKFSGSNSSSNSPAGGKRANRTRFTDYQIKVLQEFFENNSYPKDSDLEYLSKLLLLSPRVIVVWFQNARQKQRKIYENQPNSTFYENDEKKSTNINYTCKKCNLIFQRYYELIRHQKNHCFKEENNKKSAKAKIAAAQVAQSLSSEDSNSSAVDVSCDETIDLSQPSRKRKLSENAGESRYDFLYNYYLKNSVGSSSGGVGDKTLEFLIQFYQFNESKKFFHLDASPHLERTPSPQPQQQQNVIPPPPPQNIIQAPQISNTPNSSISSSQDFYESPMSSPTTIETTISVVEGGQGHNQNQAIQLSQPQINNHKRLRTTILPDQLNLLYECYQTESNPSRKMLEEISKKVNLKKRVVQ